MSDGAGLDVVNRRERHVRWSMRSRPAIDTGDLGDPRDSASYAFCAYGDGAILVRATAPSGPCRGRRSCWRKTRHGFRYDDPRASDGLSHLTLRAGTAGRSRLRVAGGGKSLLVGVLPVSDRDVTVQLFRTDDANVCWGANHTKIKTNRASRLRAVGD